MTYPIIQDKADGRVLHPQSNLCLNEKYVSEHYDLYLTDEFTRDEHGNVHRYYRLHAREPHSIEMSLAYDIRCPKCGRHTLKQVGRSRDFYTLGLYECPSCDRN
jgi:hypothetical protein